MPISGNEETRIIARQSSSCSAGVPIKKRKFPIVRPPSPPPQKPSFLPAKNDIVENKNSSPCQESSLSNAALATISTAKSDASKNLVLDTKREIPADSNVNLVSYNVNLSRGEPQDPSPTIHSDSLDTVDSKENLLLTEKSTNQKMTGITELCLQPNEAPAVHVWKEVPSEHVGRYCTSELFVKPETAELSLGPKERLVPGLVAGQSSQMPDKFDASSLCLSLSKETLVGRCKGSDVKVNSASTHVRANRSNWDLNTTMDAWEGPVGDGFGPEIVGSGGIHCIEPLKSSPAVLGVVGDMRKQFIEAGDKFSNFPMSSLSPSGKYKSEDSLHLSLGTSFAQSNYSGEHSCSSAKVDSGRVQPNSNLVRLLVSTGNMSSPGCKTVKSELFDENAKHDTLVAGGNPVGLSDLRTVNRELVERCSTKAFKSSNVSPENLVEHRLIKSEPVQEGNKETQRTAEVISHKSVEKAIQCLENVSSAMIVALAPKKSCPSGLPTCSDLSIGGDPSNQLECSTYTKEVHINMDTTQGVGEMVDQVAGEMVFASVGHESKESNASEGMIHSGRPEDENVDDPETCRLEVMNYVPMFSRRTSEGFESDEEKINISADILEEDSYGSDYESAGKHDVVAPLNSEGRLDGKEDEEYEDGEVREALVHTAVEVPTEDREVEKANLGDCDGKNLEALDIPVDDSIAQAPPAENDGKVEDHGELNDNNHIKECVDDILNKEADLVVDRDSSLQESSTVEDAAAGADEKRPIKATRGSLDQSGRNDVHKDHDTEELSDGATNGGQGIETTVIPVADVNIIGPDTVQKSNLTFPKTESSRNGKDAAKDTNDGGSRSRIINLPRASYVTSPCKPRFISDRPFRSTTGRERYADFDGEKVYLRRNRGDFYGDGPRKFERDRFQDQSLRNYRTNFGRGRGRVFRQRDEWDSDRNFAPEMYNGPSDHRFPRHKRGSAVGDAELEGNGYGMAPDRALGMGRGGRKPLSDELPSFCHPSSRRLSLGVRDGTGTRSIQLVQRIPSNVSPSRCTREDGSDLVGLRHGEKLMRGLPEDVIDPEFTRPQPMYEGLDNQFGRGYRNFSTVQRGLPRIRSKSPVRSRTRSPGPWSSPRRRSPDGFNGPPELTRRRSSDIYRMERIRSPDRPCFPEERAARKRGSPSYMTRPSNDLRDIDSGRVGHPRPVIRNRRSPSDRGLPRSTRRFDIIDPRERTDNDEYFGGPIHSGRFNELGGDGNGDERRKCGERRGLVRSFKPPFNGPDGENLSIHLVDGPRPFRFCPEADSELIERGNLREREFERRTNNRPGVPPRRMRSLEEQEGNYGHGGQVWHDDGFDDVSQMKRRRF